MLLLWDTIVYIKYLYLILYGCDYMAIYKVKEYDLLATALDNGTYYFCTDSMKLYKDTSTGRHEVNAVVVSTEIERISSIRPANGRYYYIFETNELWLYNAGWSIVVGTARTSSGYYYNNNKIYSTSDINEVLDNNGLLGDGSVVVRDTNRIIKGKMYIDPDTNNYMISSFLGKGIILLPGGSDNEKGKLEIKSVISYEGLDSDGNQVINNVSGELEFSGDMYVYDIDTQSRSKVVTMDDLINLGLIKSE